MAAAFPDTPVTLVTQLAKSGIDRNRLWSTFFDLYHEPIEMAVCNAFRRVGWHNVPAEVLEDTVAEVVVSLLRAPMIYDPAKGKFRNYLYQLANWRVKDRLKISCREQERRVPLESVAEPEDPTEPSAQLVAREEEAFRASMLAALLEEVRLSVAPKTYLMFEMAYLKKMPPVDVARFFNVKRNVVDNAVYRIIEKLRTLAAQSPYRQELQTD